MQVMNEAHPNSTRNTCLLAVFKTGDSVSNLHIALDQYLEHGGATGNQVISVLYFRDWTIQLFISGDYEFLCTMCGDQQTKL